MFWGILIGVVLTVLTVVIAVAVGNKRLTPLSYIVIVLALAAFCIEGVGLTNAIRAKKNTENNVTALQAAALNYLPSEAKDYRIGEGEVSGLKIGLQFLYPELARYIKSDELIGRTVAETTDVLRHAVKQGVMHRIWMNILYMVITMVLGIVLLVVTENLGGSSFNGYGTASGGSPDDYLGF